MKQTTEFSRQTNWNKVPLPPCRKKWSPVWLRFAGKILLILAMLLVLWLFFAPPVTG